jgi:putative endopeptidase
LAEPEKVIAFVGAGGISLPDRDDYLRQDVKSKRLRLQYLAHLTRVFALLSDASVVVHARSMLTSDTSLARARLSGVQ